MKVINQRRLAELAGVSVSTVSKAFSNSHEISEATRRHIFALAKKHGCFDKYCSEQYGTKTVAIISPEFSNNVYTNGIEYLEQRLRDRGYIALLAFYNYSDGNIEKLVNYFTEYAHVDGIILMGGEFASQVRAGSVPIVCYGGSPGHNPYIDIFRSEYRFAVSEAVGYLHALGHRDIAFVGELLTDAKLDYFKEAMKNNNLKINDSFIRISHARCEEAGFTETEKLIGMTCRPTAVICAYDTIAFGVINAIKANGLDVPSDFSVIGMNNVKQSTYSGIELTTIQEIPDELYDMMFELLCKRMNGSNVPRQTVTLYGEFVRRNSAAPPHTV